jgi:signal transduction histidine kinase
VANDVGRHGGVHRVVRDAPEHTQAEQALRCVNERLEDAIKQIAHALHDEAGQLLAMVHLAVKEIARELPYELRPRLDRISVPLDVAADQLRHLAHELRPVILDDFGLVPAVEYLAQGVSKRTGLAISVESSLTERLPSLIETALYRIIQEALTNVGKHARARRVRIQLRRTDQEINCTIHDNGVGFDMRARPTRDRPRLGLIIIRDRLAALGGTLSIATGRGRGTTLVMTIPLEPRSWPPG